MGGMGTIHGSNEFQIYEDNHHMNVQLLKACLHPSSITKFFYASSACVYSEEDGIDATADLRLRESDAWKSGVPPTPQGLYGLEKLQFELVLSQPQIQDKLSIQIARFHNIFGPGGAWNDGREKAPAALTRKALVAKLFRDRNSGATKPDFEIWGDGTQRRSFLYIDDCVDGVMKLLNSDCRVPVNIGSDRSVTVQELAQMALASNSLMPSHVQFRSEPSKPVGVASRNSDNTFAMKTLDGWTPAVSLEEGMRKTSEWMMSELEALLKSTKEESERDSMLKSFASSRVLNFDNVVTFNILLPITSRGTSQGPRQCLESLREFCSTLMKTTRRDRATTTSTAFRIKILLGIDHDDHALLREGSGMNEAERIMREAGVEDITTVLCYETPGRVCAIWRKLARTAWEVSSDTSGNAYFVLMGDDIKLQSEGWMSSIHDEFGRISQESALPLGFGCVAFEDQSFPGMPTFPVVHKLHLDIFAGEVVPEIFLNQDGDPFLFQLYRRWGCATMSRDAVLWNSIGGSDSARYVKESALAWSFGPLDRAVTHASSWLASQTVFADRSQPKLSIDIVVPSYRVQLPLLERILALRPSNRVVTMYIIIIDDPKSSERMVLEAKYGHRADVRIRTNSTNLGASASRNRGLKESSADWVVLLDDDIEPDDDLLLNVERSILEHPKAAGFVGNVSFPPADSIFKTAVHLSGVTYFWNIADKMKDDLPWGVTANLVVRRNHDDVDFDLAFPKTGGGEDIDFCRRKCAVNPGSCFVHAPDVRVTHPWWAHGRRTYWRFYGWGEGDSNLIGKYPEYRYRDFAPNSSEWFLLSFVIALLGGPTFAILSVRLALSTLVGNVVHDYYRHLWVREFDMKAIPSQSSVMVQGWQRLAAIGESALIRMASEGGKTAGLLRRGEWHLFGMRFDWFTGKWGSGPRDNERKNNVQRMLLILSLFCMFFSSPR